MNFERFEVKAMPNSGWKVIKHVFKKINQSDVNVDLVMSLNRTYETIFLHLVTYVQSSSNAYRKGLEFWEDVCKISGGDNINVLIRVITGTLLPYTNFIRRCPYPPGLYHYKLKSLRSDMFNFGQLLPAGRFRLEINFTDRYDGKVIGTNKLYFSISDHRIEQF